MNLKPKGDESVTAVAQELFNIVEDATYTSIRGMQQKGDHQAPNHLYVILTAAAAAIQFAAKIISQPEDMTNEENKAWAEKPANRTAILTSALILSRCLLPYKDGVALDFNGANICAAVEAMKKVTGNSNVSDLNKILVEIAERHASPVHFFDNSRDQFGDLIPTVH